MGIRLHYSAPPVLDEKMSRASVSDNKMFESTSFIETQSQTYKDHPPIMISDNEEFSDITKLLENDTDEENSWNSNANSPFKIRLCQREISLRLLAVGVFSVVVLVVLFILLYRQTLAEVDVLLDSENK